MTHDATVAVFRNEDEAKRALEFLVAEGIPPEQLSIICRTLKGSPHLREDVDVGDKSEKDAARGAALGGTFGVLAGLATLAVPGLGLVTAAGALALGMTGAIAGAALGSYIGFGLPENHVRKYEELLNAGNVLVIAHGNPLTVAQAHAALRTLDPPEIHLHAATAGDSPEIDDTPPGPRAESTVPPTRSMGM